MTKEQLYNKIAQCTYGDPQDKDAFLAYISGETNCQPASINILISIIQINSDYFEDLDCAEMLIRMLQLLGKYKPRMLQRIMYNSVDRYEVYKKAGLSDQFLKQEIYERLLLYRGLNIISMWQNKLQSDLKQMLESCPHIVKEFLLQLEACQEEQQFAAFVLLAGYLRDLDSKGKALPENWESAPYGLMKQLYSGEKIKKAFESYAEQPNSDIAGEGCTVQIQMKPALMEKLLIVFSLFCFGLSPKGDDILRISLLLIDTRKMFDMLGYLGFEMEFIKSRRLPLIFSLRHWAFGLLNIHRMNAEVQYAGWIRETLKRNTELFISILEELLQKKELMAAPLVAVALQETHPKALKWLSSLEEVSVESLDEKQKQNNYCLVETVEGKPDFSCLQKPDFVPPNTPRRISLFRNSVNELCMACIYVMPYSMIGTNIVKSILLKTDKYIVRNMHLIPAYGLFCAEQAKPFFDTADEMHLSIELLFQIYRLENYFDGNAKEKAKNDFIHFLLSHKAQAEKGIETFAFEQRELLEYLQLLYEKNNGFDPKALLLAFNRRSKPVASYAEKLLATREAETRPEVEALLQAESKIASAAAFRLIRLWDNNKVEETLKKLNTVEELTDYIQKQYTKSNEKNVPFAKEIDYGSVRARDTEEFLPEILLKYYVSEYILLMEIYFIKACKKIQEFANPYDLRALMKQIYEFWIEEGASVKYKNVLIPFALTGGDSQLAELKKQIDYWSENKKPSLAAFAVQALCMNGSKIALLQADTMAKKHKNKKVRNAAQEAMELTAQEMGMSMEELNDLIIPDLGFNRNRERFFDYGKRQFKGILNDKLEILLYDPTGKAIKSLPKASAKFEDNEDMVTAAKEDLKAAKKQMKLIVDSQKPRMSRAIITKRTWTAEKWQALFVDNPIMSLFAMGLIWEECSQEGKLLQTFRYMEDGTFNTAEEEEHTLSENSLLCLLHPSDVEKEVVEAWKEQLSDYEIIQPVTQLDIPVYEITPENRDKKAIYDFQNKRVRISAFKSAANKLGMSLYFNSNGECAGCFFKGEGTDITVLLLTSGFYPGDFNNTTVIDAIVFKKGGLNTGGLELQFVPPRLLSFGILAGRTIAEKAEAL